MKTLKPETVHDILDQIQFGDHITVTRTNLDGSLTATVTGPALVDQPTVGIDLLDGGPHVVRQGDGRVWGDFTRVMATRDGELFGAEYVPGKSDPAPAAADVAGLYDGLITGGHQDIMDQVRGRGGGQR